MLGKILIGLGITDISFNTPEDRTKFQQTCLNDIPIMNYTEKELINENEIKYAIELFSD